MLKAYKMDEYYEMHMNNKEYPEFSLSKMINCQNASISGINTTAYLSRIELYVDEFKWKKACMRIKWAFTTFINIL
jgi:hypothetical protein